MNSLEALENVKDKPIDEIYVHGHSWSKLFYETKEYNIIKKDLEKLQAIESADLSEGERITIELKSIMTKRTQEIFGKDLTAHDNNLFNSLDKTIKKSKLLESIIRLLDKQTIDFVYSDECLGLMFDTPTCSSCDYYLEHNCSHKDNNCPLSKLMKFFKEIQSLLGVESNE